VFVFPSSMLFSQRRRVVELITKYALPPTFPAQEYAQLGGLMAYGASITELWRPSAFYVDSIFKGAKPSELPVEQPTKFELVINHFRQFSNSIVSAMGYGQIGEAVGKA